MRKKGSEEEDRPRFHIPSVQLSASLSSTRGAGADLLDLEVDENSLGFRNTVRRIQEVCDQLPKTGGDYA